MPFKKIVLLAGQWDTTPVVYHFLQQHLSVDKAIIEEGVGKKEFLKKRIKKLGWISVSGQVLFQIVVGKRLKKNSAKRIAGILQQYNLNNKPIDKAKILNIASVNSDTCLLSLNQLNPDLVIIHGTRIISKKILQQVNAKFINIHAGITPRYRGSHGAYWALYNDDEENCGVTVHLVDAGIDTGRILAQGKIPLTQEDNFITYPYLQLAEGLYMMKESIKKIEQGEKPEVHNTLNSALWYHPTLWGYLWKRITKGIK